MRLDASKLPDMFKEVREVNVMNGWQPHDLTKGEVLALLHSEVSEALDAYRVGGFGPTYGPGNPPKVEGVGSELADVLIRWIDNLDMFNVLPEYVCIYDGGRFGMSERFADALNVLHDLISRFSIALDSYESCPLPGEKDGLRHHYRRIYYFLVDMAQHFGFDLYAEYERKLAYNRTRGYKHGGKRL